MQELTLYYIPTCPFCRKVMNYMEINNISVNMQNRDESPEARKKLIEIGGKPQVPCLVIDGQALYESDDIIDWFEKNWKED